jgi:hypothetical protein
LTIHEDDQGRQRCIDLLAEVVARHGCVCHDCCGATSHDHLLAETPAANLSHCRGQLNGGQSYRALARQLRHPRGLPRPLPSALTRRRPRAPSCTLCNNAGTDPNTTP